MKILLTGASGLLGRAFVRALTADHDLYATAFSRAGSDYHRLDLRNKDAVLETVRSFNPDLIIHSAAERRPDVCENDPQATNLLNVESVHYIAEAAKEVDAALLYISTDYVFDGTTPPYAIDAQPNPLNFYGQSKLAGEKAVIQSGVIGSIMRVPMLYGPVESLAESSVTIIAELLKEQVPCKVDDWAVRYPTHVDDVADATRSLIEQLESGVPLPPIVHVSGADAVSKYDMVNRMAEACELKADHLTPDSEPPAGAPRPQNSQLDNTLIDQLAPFKRRSFSDCIGPIIAPFL